MTMRTSVWLLGAILLVATGCGSDERSAESRQAEEALLADPDLAPRPLTPEEAAQLRARAVAALRAVLPGAAEATFSDVRRGTGGAICGSVDPTAGRTTGAARPFIVTADGAAIVSATPDLRLEDPDDPFPDLYMQLCASVEELRRIGTRMQGLAPPDVMLNMPVADEPLADAAPVAPAERANEARQPPTATDDSFFNSVLRSSRRDEPPR